MKGVVLDSEGSEPMVNPTWCQVVEAIRALDGIGRTLVCLGKPLGPSLMVGGGNAGRYLVNYLVDLETQENFVLSDPSAQGEDAEICAGGQVGVYPVQWCVSLEMVLAACDHYLQTGNMMPQFAWVKG